MPRVERDAEVGESSGPVFGKRGLRGHGWFMKMMAMWELIDMLEVRGDVGNYALRA